MTDYRDVDKRIATLEERIAFLEEIVRYGIGSERWPTSVQVWGFGKPPQRRPNDPNELTLAHVLGHIK